ncbi:MAG: hypothetical protein LBB51_01235, partial [Zoogloeaceae bacterium]|nr:hypothetical protein [Zoogloeaceae bacterium]
GIGAWVSWDVSAAFSEVSAIESNAHSRAFPEDGLFYYHPAFSARLLERMDEIKSGGGHVNNLSLQ